MKIKTKTSKNVKTIRFEGSLTIDNADEIRRALLKRFKPGEIRILSLEDATDADLTCLQLFCAAHRSSLDGPGELRLDRNQPAFFKELAAETGFTRYNCCSTNKTKQGCLWVEVNNG